MNHRHFTTRFLNYSLLILFGALFAFFLAYLLLDLLLPFTAALASAVILSPLSRRIGKRTRMSLRILRLFILFTLMSLLSFVFVFGTIKLLDEAGVFFSSLYTKLEILLEKLFALLKKFPSQTATGEAVASAIGSAIENAMSELSAKSASLAAHFVAKLPALLFSLLIFLISLFYFSFDYESITAYLASLVPPKYHDRLNRLKQHALKTTKCFFRAYWLLFLLTFAELYLAFLFLKVEHAFLLSLLAATFDMLPAVGVGIVLLPWATLLFLNGATTRAIIILVITLVVTLIRQIAEPHIIGKNFGIHPLASLISLYIGLRFVGVIGILISPFAALAASEALSLYRKKIQEKTDV